MSTAEAALLRRRASHLRSMAAHMRTTGSMSLHRDAGVDTWMGPRAHTCTCDLIAAQRSVHDAADDLDVRAHRLERDADDLVAAAVRVAQEAHDPGADRTN